MRFFLLCTAGLSLGCALTIGKPDEVLSRHSLARRLSGKTGSGAATVEPHLISHPDVDSTASTNKPQGKYTEEGIAQHATPEYPLPRTTDKEWLELQFRTDPANMGFIRNANGKWQRTIYKDGRSGAGNRIVIYKSDSQLRKMGLEFVTPPMRQQLQEHAHAVSEFFGAVFKPMLVSRKSTTVSATQGTDPKTRSATDKINDFLRKSIDFVATKTIASLKHTSFKTSVSIFTKKDTTEIKGASFQLISMRKGNVEASSVDLSWPQEAAGSTNSKQIAHAGDPDAGNENIVEHSEEAVGLLSQAPTANAQSRMLKRRNIIGSIQGTEGQVSDDSQPSSVTTKNNYKADFQNYLDAYQYAQTQASSIVIPYIEIMLNGTNSTLMYDAAWSMYTELTMAPEQLVGPFMGGLTCIEHLEQAYMKSTNHPSLDELIAKNPKDFTRDDMAVLQWYAVHEAVGNVYELAYQKAWDALDKAGLLKYMFYLRANLMPNDTSIMPAGYATVVPQSFSSQYFTNYNQFMDTVTSGNDTTSVSRV